MQQYELLSVVPGTLSEDEVQPIAKSVEQILASAGAKKLEMKNLGKSRLAYPVKHIRYGYFFVSRFEAETSVVAAITETLRLSGQLLRAVLRKSVTGAPTFEHLTPIADVMTRERDERPEIDGGARVSTEEETRQIRTVQPEPVKATLVGVKTETKAEDIKLDEIDKKLDEILGADISNV